MTDTFLPVAEARDHFSALITSVETTHEKVVITRNGRPVAVIIATDVYESMVETIDVLSDPDIAEAVREAADGPVYTMEEVRAELVARASVTATGRREIPTQNQAPAQGAA